jgi:hypothetical protein
MQFRFGQTPVRMGQPLDALFWPAGPTSKLCPRTDPNRLKWTIWIAVLGRSARDVVRAGTISFIQLAIIIKIIYAYLVGGER